MKMMAIGVISLVLWLPVMTRMPEILPVQAESLRPASPLTGQPPPEIRAELFAPGMLPAEAAEFNDHDPFIAPDESCLIFSSNRPGGYGSNDLYISFRNDNDTWTAPRNMGA